MGWISDRHMKSGGSLYEGGPKKKGPLRRIIRVVVYYGNLFTPDRVELECGHTTHSWGGVRAICEECGKESKR